MHSYTSKRLQAEIQAVMWHWTICYLTGVCQLVEPGFPGSAPGLGFWLLGNPGGHSWPEPDAAECLLPQLDPNQTPPDS